MSLSEPTLLGTNSVGSKGEEAHSGHQMGDVIKQLAVATTKVALTCASPTTATLAVPATQAPPDYSSAASPTLHSSCESKATKASTPQTRNPGHQLGGAANADQDCCNDDSLPNNHHNHNEKNHCRNEEIPTNIAAKEEKRARRRSGLESLRKLPTLQALPLI